MSIWLASVAVYCLIPVGTFGLLLAHELGYALPVLFAGGRARLTIGVLGVVLLGGVDGPSFWVVANLLVGESYRLYRTVVPKTYSRGPYAGTPSDGKRFLRLVRS
ncbi:hypothetical protein [Halorussus halobius]|uniref:hypothetical protein n=1 Tax=Halorussus halobius TaxID=1710537 RepID=UPI001092AA25|nr:hypothetical protein [Halorussus halobius]